jgi:hypothetical protein
VVGCCKCGNEPLGSIKCRELSNWKSVSFSGRTLLLAISFTQVARVTFPAGKQSYRRMLHPRHWHFRFTLHCVYVGNSEPSSGRSLNFMSAVHGRVMSWMRFTLPNMFLFSKKITRCYLSASFVGLDYFFFFSFTLEEDFFSVSHCIFDFRFSSTLLIFWRELCGIAVDGFQWLVCFLLLILPTGLISEGRTATGVFCQVEDI